MFWRFISAKVSPQIFMETQLFWGEIITGKMFLIEIPEGWKGQEDGNLNVYWWTVKFSKICQFLKIIVSCFPDLLIVSIVYLYDLGTQSFGLVLFLILLCSLRRPTESYFRHLPPPLPSQFYQPRTFKKWGVRAITYLQTGGHSFLFFSLLACFSYGILEFEVNEYMFYTKKCHFSSW